MRLETGSDTFVERSGSGRLGRGRQAVLGFGKDSGLLDPTAAHPIWNDETAILRPSATSGTQAMLAAAMLVPECAMRVSGSSDGGAPVRCSRGSPCWCLFEVKANGSTTCASCKVQGDCSAGQAYSRAIAKSSQGLQQAAVCRCANLLSSLSTPCRRSRVREPSCAKRLVRSASCKTRNGVCSSSK